MSVHRVSDPGVKAVFASYPQEMRWALQDLRETILDVAAAVRAVGSIEESLKWGQPAYRPVSPSTGTTVRIGPVTGSATDYALFFHCQTSLAADFEALYPGMFRIVGGRALVFSLGDVAPDMPLRHCIALALTHHLRDGVDVSELEQQEAVEA
ncbi:MAG: DUF1801 domain-containing protein [Hyphomonadaceae bacterium]|nr:DUF1801 domain-containing protein [Hyphomonadaceae bacterium]